MSFFTDDLVSHKNLVGKFMTNAQCELSKRAVQHDLDKITNPVVFDIYEKYSEPYRKISYIDPSKVKYEKLMYDGVTPHVKNNRHHFYDKRNLLDFSDMNFLDFIEITSDWLAASDRDCKDNKSKLERFKILIESKIKEENKNMRIIFYNTAKVLLGE